VLNQDIESLFHANKVWADQKKQVDPDYFSKLSHQQAPEYLWIGCSDSRVPANEILGLDPGEVFVHRNIANVVVHSDLNCLSVVQYAVDVLEVKHIIVCGHYGCGGVHAADGEEQLGLIDNWLLHIKDIRTKHTEELSKLNTQDRVARLCELNVIEQVNNLSNTTIVKNAWSNNHQLTVHGWIYSLEDGLLRDLQVQRDGA
jgi:carbonic anhydrase